MSGFDFDGVIVNIDSDIFKTLHIISSAAFLLFIAGNKIVMLLLPIVILFLYFSTVTYFNMFQQSEKLKKKTCLVREAPTPSAVSLEASVSKVIVAFCDFSKNQSTLSYFICF